MFITLSGIMRMMVMMFGIFMMMMVTLSKPVLISPCLCLSLAFASFLLYLGRRKDEEVGA